MAAIAMNPDRLAQFRSAEASAPQQVDDFDRVKPTIEDDDFDSVALPADFDPTERKRTESVRGGGPALPSIGGGDGPPRSSSTGGGAPSGSSYSGRQSRSDAARPYPTSDRASQRRSQRSTSSGRGGGAYEDLVVKIDVTPLVEGWGTRELNQIRSTPEESSTGKVWTIPASVSNRLNVVLPADATANRRAVEVSKYLWSIRTLRDAITSEAKRNRYYRVSEVVYPDQPHQFGARYAVNRVPPTLGHVFQSMGFNHRSAPLTTSGSSRSTTAGGGAVRAVRVPVTVDISQLTSQTAFEAPPPDGFEPDEPEVEIKDDMRRVPAIFEAFELRNKEIKKNNDLRAEKRATAIASGAVGAGVPSTLEFKADVTAGNTLNPSMVQLLKEMGERKYSLPDGWYGNFSLTPVEDKTSMNIVTPTREQLVESIETIDPSDRQVALDLAHEIIDAPPGQELTREQRRWMIQTVMDAGKTVLLNPEYTRLHYRVTEAIPTLDWIGDDIQLESQQISSAASVL